MTEIEPQSKISELQLRLQQVEALRDIVPEAHEFLLRVATTEAETVSLNGADGTQHDFKGGIQASIRVEPIPASDLRIPNGYIMDRDDHKEWSFPGTNTHVVPEGTIRGLATPIKSKGLIRKQTITIPDNESVSNQKIGLVETVFTDGEIDNKKPATQIRKASVVVVHTVSATGIAGVARALVGTHGNGVPASQTYADVPRTYNPIAAELPTDIRESVVVYLSPDKMEKYKQNISNITQPN